MDGKVSRIVPTLASGAGVVTSRGDVHHVVTEHGRVDLFAMGSTSGRGRSSRSPIRTFAKSWSSARTSCG